MPDAWMLVSETMRCFGTIGGGRLELEAIEKARGVSRVPQLPRISRCRWGLPSANAAAGM
jgi:xanthine/CO dehydrogenase XdhC/CoxF family maturation factor